MMLRHLLYKKGVDDSAGTYVTDYILGCECVIFIAAAIVFKACKISQFLHTGTTFAFFCAFLAIAAIFGGIVHNIYPHNEKHPGTPLGYIVLWRFTTISTGFAGMMLFLLGFSLVMFLCKKMVVWYVLICVSLMIGAVNAIYQAIKPSLMIAGGVFVIGAFVASLLALFSLIRLKGSKYATNMIVVGLWIMVIGSVYQAIAGGVCGAVNAHENGCPLPDYFNHNALFHIIEMIGLFFLGWGCIVIGREEKIKEEDEVELNEEGRSPYGSITN